MFQERSLCTLKTPHETGVVTVKVTEDADLPEDLKYIVKNWQFLSNDIKAAVKTIVQHNTAPAMRPERPKKPVPVPATEPATAEPVFDNLR